MGFFMSRHFDKIEGCLAISYRYTRRSMSLEDHGIKTGLIPNGGDWYYSQPFKGYIERIPTKGSAGSAKDLVKLVKDYRATNGLTVETTEEDIAAFIKSISPENARFPKRKAAPKAEVVSFVPYIERLRAWLLGMANKTVRLLIEDEVDPRIFKCVTCPHNVKWKTGCIPCCDDVVDRGVHLRQRPSYPGADMLGACRLHNFYLPAAVFIDRDDLPATNPEAPEHCWMK